LENIFWSFCLITGRYIHQEISHFASYLLQHSTFNTVIEKRPVMKNQNCLLLFLLLLSTCNLVVAQNFEVPMDVSLQTQGDYTRYEPTVIAAANWLESIPLQEEAEKRKQTGTFLLQWLVGSAKVTVELQKHIADFTDTAPELLLVFMAGWAKYQLQNPTTTDKAKLNTAGIRSVLKVYELGGVAANKK